MEVGGKGDYSYTVTTRMISTLRWAAMIHTFTIFSYQFSLVTTKITSEKRQHNSRYKTELEGRKKATTTMSQHIYICHPTTSGH